MQFLQLLKVMAQLLPMLGQIVQAVENIMPLPGQGAKKLALVRQILDNAYKIAGDLTIAFDTLWPLISGAIASIVTLNNATGVFSRSPVTATVGNALAKPQPPAEDPSGG
jgi:hypothetical protein